jgi:hypothetical protein
MADRAFSLVRGPGSPGIRLPVWPVTWYPFSFAILNNYFKFLLLQPFTAPNPELNAGFATEKRAHGQATKIPKEQLRSYLS